MALIKISSTHLSSQRFTLVQIPFCYSRNDFMHVSREDIHPTCKERNEGKMNIKMRKRKKADNENKNLNGIMMWARKWNQTEEVELEKGEET
ncbi:hypothetical protein MGYG_02762 [Nannizzia gypsea CBS 118893]|uniref:Uncharacterized protein n=1 Tax=Arthroderma gypseum (strain ATCC MYA-4604 / CBS 118893) TaxID=535722 RepID=E4UNZ6_ARTGP|nr:hypothetical protein MGYG_02762 [Nannizzia gypsea CBS 118893]EFQ99749.1 hypothetical protein MGYG_02762 [Nannizzia gypsea CBS 118893]